MIHSTVVLGGQQRGVVVPESGCWVDGDRSIDGFPDAGDDGGG